MALANIVIPNDSLLHKWLHAQSPTEVPRAFQLCCGLSLMGVVLRRSVWIEQIRWRVWPNMSVLLVGPSGIGKDTIIDQVVEVVRRLTPQMIVGGRTMELIYQRLLELGDPAAAYIPVPELSAFFGGKDYKKSMVQEFTDLLSTKSYLDVSLKGQPNSIIMRPTPTVHAGTTADWLHVAMPEGSLEGGFVPRFLVVCEDYVEKHVPLVKFAVTYEERKAIDDSYMDFIAGLEELRLEHWVKGTEYVMTEAARSLYSDWYTNRLNRMPRTIEAYAVRSRDHVLRMAMLCGVSRGRNFIDIDDTAFAISLMDHIVERLEPAVAPMTKEFRCAQDIMELLPASHKELMGDLLQRYDRRTIIAAEQSLTEAGRVAVSDRTGQFVEISSGG